VRRIWPDESSSAGRVLAMAVEYARKVVVKFVGSYEDRTWITVL
jgi:hypothetical protein